MSMPPTPLPYPHPEMKVVDDSTPYTRLVEMYEELEGFITRPQNGHPEFYLNVWETLSGRLQRQLDIFVDAYPKADPRFIEKTRNTVCELLQRHRKTIES